MKEKISITLDEDLVGLLDSMVDKFTIHNRSQAIEFLIKKSIGIKKTAVILAGGPEEKLKVPRTNTWKPLVRFYGGGTLIELLIKKLKESNFRDIFIVGQKNLFVDIFKIIGNGENLGVVIKYVEENQKSYPPLSTARALKLLKGKINSAFVCLPCDRVFKYDLNNIFKFHVKNNGVATIGMITSPNPSKHGIVEVEGNKVVAFVEKPKEASSNLINIGTYVLEPEIFDLPGNSLEYDIFPELAKKGQLLGYVFSEESVHITDKDISIKIKK